MKRLLLSVALLFSISNSYAQSFAVVELYTSSVNTASQPADQLLNRLGKEAEEKKQPLFPLAFHVDYWNTPSKSDPLSKYQFTLRQENYSRLLPQKELYTPQVIVNGTKECTGSKEKDVRALIAQEWKADSSVQIEVNKDSLRNDTMYVSFKIGKSGKEYALRFALTENGVQAGTSTFDHVVRVFTSVNSPLGNGQCKIPLKGMSVNAKFRLTVFLQEKKSMRIVGAVRIRP